MYLIIISVAIIILGMATFKAFRAIRRHDREGGIFDLEQRFYSIEEKNNLKFNKKERINNFVIALEKVRKKLFIFKKIDDNYELLIVDLKKIKSCFKQRIYKSMVTDSKGNCARDLDKIIIEFVDMTGDERVQVPFYESIQNMPMEILELEHKADEWKIILENTIVNHYKEPA